MDTELRMSVRNDHMAARMFQVQPRTQLWRRGRPDYTTSLGRRWKHYLVSMKVAEGPKCVAALATSPNCNPSPGDASAGERRIGAFDVER